MLPFPALEHVILLEVKFRVDSKAKCVLVEQRIVERCNLVFTDKTVDPMAKVGQLGGLTEQEALDLSQEHALSEHETYQPQHIKLNNNYLVSG